MKLPWKKTKKNRNEIYKKIAQIIALNEMISKNNELLNTMLSCRLDIEEDYDLDILFDRCECTAKHLKENKEILLQELLELDHKAYKIFTHECPKYSKSFVVNFDKDREVYFPLPAFISNEKGIEYNDINAITLSIDYVYNHNRIRLIK